VYGGCGLTTEQYRKKGGAVAFVEFESLRNRSQFAIDAQSSTKEVA
jgi:hypothetical protein